MCYPHHLRVLIIDENPAICEDLRQLLSPEQMNEDPFDAEDDFLFTSDEGIDARSTWRSYQFASATDGQQALEKVVAAADMQRPYSLVIVDMPIESGWDGLETVQQLWQADRNLLIIFCIASMDQTWEEMHAALGRSDRFVILKKPYDIVEIQQLVAAMTSRWKAEREAEANVRKLVGLTSEYQCLLTQVREMSSRVQKLTMDLIPLSTDAITGRVLLIDANLLTQSQTGHRLTQHGAHVSSFETGEDALHELRLLQATQHPPAAIVLETSLPGMAGPLCIRELRRTGYNGPILAYTSQERDGNREVCLRSGCDHWLRKSDGIDRLLSCLRATLQSPAPSPDWSVQRLIDEQHWPDRVACDPSPYDQHLQALMSGNDSDRCLPIEPVSGFNPGLTHENGPTHENPFSRRA